MSGPLATVDYNQTLLFTGLLEEAVPALHTWKTSVVDTFLGINLPGLAS